MPARAVVARELGAFLGVLSHPQRIRIVEELRAGEQDVRTLQEATSLSQSNVSQHLALLRAHRIVEERREGRHVYYHLRQPDLAAWLMAGLRFLEGERAALEQFHAAAEEIRTVWPEAFDAPSFPSQPAAAEPEETR